MLAGSTHSKIVLIQRLCRGLIQFAKVLNDCLQVLKQQAVCKQPQCSLRQGTRLPDGGLYKVRVRALMEIFACSRGFAWQLKAQGRLSSQCLEPAVS